MGEYINVRKGPGTSYEIATKIKDGANIYCEPYNNQWYKVFNDYNDRSGYTRDSCVCFATPSMHSTAASSMTYPFASINSLSCYMSWRNEVQVSELNKFEKYSISFIQKYGYSLQ